VSRATGIRGLTLTAVILAGCSSVYLQHPDTGRVIECEPWKAGIGISAYIDRELCVKRWEKKGYVLMETTQALKQKARADEEADKEEENRARLLRARPSSE
jgi:hypothetical protein